MKPFGYIVYLLTAFFIGVFVDSVAFDVHDHPYKFLLASLVLNAISWGICNKTFKKTP